MWTAEKVDEATDDDGRLRHVVVFTDGTRKVGPESFHGDVVAQVRARVAALNAQDAEPQQKIPMGPIELAEPEAEKLTDAQVARTAYELLSRRTAAAIMRNAAGWPNEDLVATLRAQMKADYRVEFND